MAGSGPVRQDVGFARDAKLGRAADSLRSRVELRLLMP